jgi:hypothetical protein
MVKSDKINFLEYTQMIKKLKEFICGYIKENKSTDVQNAGFIEDEQQKRAIKFFNTF